MRRDNPTTDHDAHACRLVTTFCEKKWKKRRVLSEMEYYITGHIAVKCNTPRRDPPEPESEEQPYVPNTYS